MFYLISKNNHPQTPPNKACTGRWGFCAVYKHFSGFEFFLLPNRVHARPSASNANRWAASQKIQIRLQQCLFVNRAFTLKLDEIKNWKSKMSWERKTTNPHHSQDDGKKLARVVKATFSALKIFLSALTIFLAIGLGDTFLPDWLLGVKWQIIGISLLIIVVLFLLSPLAVEVTEKPRPLSGIGKNPKSPPDLPKIDF